MSTAPETDVDPVDRIRDAERILRALRQAAYEALLDHKRTGDASGDDGMDRGIIRSGRV